MAYINKQIVREDREDGDIAILKSRLRELHKHFPMLSNPFIVKRFLG